MRINIEEVESNFQQRQAWNTPDITKVEFIKEGKVVEVPEKILEDFAFTGLMNTDFVNMFDWESLKW